MPRHSDLGTIWRHLLAHRSSVLGGDTAQDYHPSHGGAGNAPAGTSRCAHVATRGVAGAAISRRSRLIGQSNRGTESVPDRRPARDTASPQRIARPPEPAHATTTTRLRAHAAA